MSDLHKIGDFLIRIKRPVNLMPENDYKLVTIKMNHKGVVLRGTKKGGEIKSKMYEVKKGDFILSGIDARNGAFGIVPGELDGAIVTNDFWYFKIDESIISKNLFFELTSTSWFDEICNRGSDGTTQRIRLQKDKFFNQSISIPLLEDQSIILNKIQRFKTGQTNISKEIQSQKTFVSQLKQAILQEAIQGKLTCEWREKNREHISGKNSAASLLENIRVEKDQLIQAKKIKNGKKQQSIDLGNIKPNIPRDWEFPDLDDITQFITDGTHQTPTYTQKGKIFLSAQNVKPFKFMPENHKYVSNKSYEEFSRGKKPEKGDLLVGRVGFKGETAVIDQEIDFAFYVSLGFIKTFKEFSSPDYLAIVMNSHYGNLYATGNMSSIGASAGNFNLGRIRSFPVPFPSLEEQKAIVAIVEILMEKCSVLEPQIIKSEQQAQMLMQAVLKEAFEGKEKKLKQEMV